MIEFIKKLKDSEIVKNSAWLLFDKFIRLIGGLLIGAWVARYLGPEQYGLLNFAVAFTSIFISFSMMGIDNLVIRELSKKTFDENLILGTAVRIRNIGSIFSTILALVIAIIFYSENQTFIKLVLILMVGNIFQSLDVLSIWYQSRINSKVVVKNKIIAYMLILVLKVIAIYVGADLTYFALCTVIELLIGVFLMMRWYINVDIKTFKNWIYSRKIAKLLLKEGWILAVSNLSIIVFMKSDQILLGNLIGTNAVGIYSVASLVSDILYSLPVFISMSTFPKLTYLYTEDYQEYKHYAQKVLCYMVFYSYLSLFLVSFLSDYFIYYLYGDAYRLSSDVMKIHSLTLLFVSIGCIRGNLLIIEKKSFLLSMTTIFSGFISIGLNYVLIPRYGVMGAAYAILVSQSLACYFSGCFSAKLYQIFLWQTKALFMYSVWKKILNRANG